MNEKELTPKAQEVAVSKEARSIPIGFRHECCKCYHVGNSYTCRKCGHSSCCSCRFNKCKDGTWTR